MLKIIYGRNRSKKTEHIYDLIDSDLKAGEKVILLVPEQTVLETERALCEAEIYSLECRVMSFSRLCNSIFREYGGLCYNYISKAGKYAALWKAVSLLSPMLKKYTNVTDDRNLPSLLLSAIEEFHMYQVSPDVLMNTSKLVEGELSDTLFDLSQIYAMYRDILHQHYDDPSDDLTAAEMKLRDNNFFEGVKVYIDGFSGFTKEELSLLTHIFAGSKEVILTLGYENKSRTEAFERLINTDRAVRKAADTRHVRVIDESFDMPMSSRELEFLSKELWSFSGHAYEKDVKDIGIIRCKDRRAEANALALKIKQGVLAGKRYRDFTVVAGNTDNYRGIIEAAFEKCGIPCFLSKRTEIKTKAEVRMILSALMIKIYGWQTDHVISYIQSGLASLSEDEIDMLTEYALMWNIRGKRWYDENEWRMNPKGFGYEYDEEVLSRLETLNILREKVTSPLEEFFEVFEDKPTVRQVSEALFKYLERLEIRQKINESAAKKRAEGRGAEADEDAQLWNSIINTLDTFVNIASDTLITASEYAEVLSLMFENTDIGRIPPGVDEVNVTSAGLYRGAETDCVFILGANQKIFPASPEERGILREKDRERLATLGIELDKGGESALHDELLHFYNALTNAGECAFVTYNEEEGPSFAIKALKDLFPKLCESDMSKVDAIEKIASPMTAFEYAVTNKEGSLSEKIIDLAAKKEPSLDKIKGALNIPIKVGECSVTSEVTDKISENGLFLSQSKAQKYVECPFAYFCTYVVKMSPVGTGEIDLRDVGNYVHKVLEMFFLSIKDRDITEITDEECERITKKVIEEYKSSVIKEALDKRTECLFDRLEALSMIVIKNLVKEFKVSKFRPVLFEYPIGTGGIPSLPITLDDGTNIHMNGYIDRADAYEDGDDIYIRVIDYKTGKKTFNTEDIEKGLNLQMLIYLFTLCAGKNEKILSDLGADKECTPLPAGVLYLLARIDDVRADHEPEDAAKALEDVEDSIQRVGLLTSDKDVLLAMEPGLNGRFIPVKYTKKGDISGKKSLASDKEFDEIKEKVVSKLRDIGEDIKKGRADASPLEKSKVCNYCDMKTICRRGMEEDEEENG